MSSTQTSIKKAQVVLLATHKKLAVHEVAVYEALAQNIADLLGAEFAGLYDPALHHAPGLYFIPSDTLFSQTPNDALGIQSVDDFFGGRVDQPFMATKAISHPLLKHATAQPESWCEAFCQLAGDAVLEGFTVFNQVDAQRAGCLLLKHGPVRIKPVLATAGRGQIVVNTQAQLNQAIAAQDLADITTWGLVVEEDLQDVVTFSVGQVQLAGMTASYYGTQSLTQDNHNETVYGGSALWVVRGDYGELLKLDIEAPIRHAIDQAIAYEKATIACFPAFLASRRNYDIAQGTNARGQACSGVLEQSWRIGGASAAEIEALMAFTKDPALQRICCSTHEVYGETRAPADARVLYSGDDPQVGFITKYTRVQPYEHQQ
ncbi:MAG: DUF3182 family protein [Pseudomonas sp.]